MPTLTEYKNTIRQSCTDNDQPISERFVKKLAAIHFARQTRMSDLTRERIFMHADIVPPKAFKNIQSNDLNAARRLGLVAA